GGAAACGRRAAGRRRHPGGDRPARGPHVRRALRGAIRGAPGRAVGDVPGTARARRRSRNDGGSARRAAAGPRGTRMTPDSSTLPLRDIHLPPPVGWWPPAPGWWILAGVLLLAIGAALVLRRAHRRRALRRAAER